MSIKKITGLFSDSELSEINNLLENADIHSEDSTLGRNHIVFMVPAEIRTKLEKIASEFWGQELKMDHSLYSEYNNKYGEPNLPPHYDGDICDITIDFQLAANTAWDLGVDNNHYPIENNEALMFNANHHVHWRPHKVFKDGEYVRMIFFRFYNTKNTSDYSHLRLSQDHDAFKEAREYRNSLGYIN